MRNLLIFLVLATTCAWGGAFEGRNSFEGRSAFVDAPVVVASSESVPLYAEDLLSMWTFNSSDWTNDYTGNAALTESGQDGCKTISWNPYGYVTANNSNACTWSASYAPSRYGTVAYRARQREVDVHGGYIFVLLENAGSFGTDRIRAYTKTGSPAAWITDGYRNSGTQWGFASDNIASNLWVDIVITWQTNDMRYYVSVSDGAATEYIDTVGSIDWTVTVARMFNYATHSTYGFNGDVDEIRFYGRVMASNECLSILTDMPYRD